MPASKISIKVTPGMTEAAVLKAIASNPVLVGYAYGLGLITEKTFKAHVCKSLYEAACSFDPEAVKVWLAARERGADPKDSPLHVLDGEMILGTREQWDAHYAKAV